MRKKTLLVTGLCAIVFSTLGARPRPAAQEPAARPKTVHEINDDFVRQIMARIAGHEQEPAEKVFKNVQTMKAAPAQRFLNIMNAGFSKALGVTCTHCHVENDFASDEKREKKAAREMQAMHRTINEQLNKMQNLRPNAQGHFINCSTCHRGGTDPLKAPEVSK